MQPRTNQTMHNPNDAIVDIYEKINVKPQTKIEETQTPERPKELWYEIRDPHGMIGLLRSRL
jgi:hypothetical protein